MSSLSDMTYSNPEQGFRRAGSFRGRCSHYAHAIPKMPIRRYAEKLPKVRWRARQLLSLVLPFLDLPRHDSVAFTSYFFQLSPIDNPYVAASVGDESRFLQHAGGYGNAGTASSQHLGNQFLGQGH